MEAAGLVLAAGAGRRMGGPKGLLRDESGRSWAARTAASLAEGGCSPVVVVVGASGPEVVETLPEDVLAVPAPDWAEGMGASLRAGLRALQATGADAALVALVDMPDVGPRVVRRLLAAARSGRSSLVRATWAGAPGNPVLLGRDHWEGVRRSASGDRGARAYLSEREDVVAVECGDLGAGRDLDTPADLPSGAGPS